MMVPQTAESPGLRDFGPASFEELAASLSNWTASCPGSPPLRFGSPEPPTQGPVVVADLVRVRPLRDPSAARQRRRLLELRFVVSACHESAQGAAELIVELAFAPPPVPFLELVDDAVSSDYWTSRNVAPRPHLVVAARLARVRAASEVDLVREIGIDLRPHATGSAEHGGPEDP